MWLVSDVDQTDGIQSISVTNSAIAQTATITLTGLTAAQDGAIFNTASFNTVFGAGALA